MNRGDVISHAQQPPLLDYAFRATCFWLDESPPVAGEQVTVEFGASAARASIAAVEGVMDSASLQQLRSATRAPPMIVGLSIFCWGC